MRLIILDTGTLGLLSHPRARPDALACRQWAQARLAAGARVIVPGIADYELRRELIRAGKTAGLRRLDAARTGFEFDSITQDALDKAAELWAVVRNAGLATASPGGPRRRRDPRGANGPGGQYGRCGHDRDEQRPASFTIPGN
jgi:predicted nucleic acid-binding protein